MIELMPQLTTLETSNVITLLGIRFWDLVQDTVIQNGLLVRAWPEGFPAYATIATQTPSGVYAFHGLQGMQCLEYPPQLQKSLEDLSPPENLVETTYFVIEVKDLKRRFLPLVFGVDVPFKGIFPVDAKLSPPSDTPSGCYLFSAPTRPVLPGLASIRATLVTEVDNQPNKPVPYAVAEVMVNNHIWYGITDEHGNVAILFPYPNFTDPMNLSSPGEPIQQDWEVRLCVRYQPRVLRKVEGSETPTILSIFEQQLGSIRSTTTGSTEPQFISRLVYGKELVMRTTGQPYLHISPAP